MSRTSKPVCLKKYMDFIVKEVGREGFELWFHFKCVYNNTKLIPYCLLANIYIYIFFTFIFYKIII